MLLLSSTFDIRLGNFQDNNEVSFFQSSGRIIDHIIIERSPFFLNNTSNLTLWEMDIPMHPDSQFWDIFNSISVDEKSEMHVLKTVSYNFTAPVNRTFPETGSYTIFDYDGSPIFTGRINEQANMIQLEPAFKIGLVLELPNSTDFDEPLHLQGLKVNRPYSIFYFSNGYFLNETFSLLDSFKFTFQVGFNSQPELKNDRVTPDSGDTSTNFIFFVEYFDADGDLPAYVNLVLDNITFNMAPIDDGSTPQSGIQYRIEFFNLAAGDHTFYFESSDGRNITNSLAVLDGGFPVEGEEVRSDDDDNEDEGQFAFFVLTICFVTVFIFVIVIIGLNYMTQKKMKEAGGMEPGTLPEEFMDQPMKEKVMCSECGSEIDADVRVCPECGEEFEGEEFQCPKCQKLVPEEADVCPHCGNKFLELVETPTEESEEEKRKEEKKIDDKTTVVDKLTCSECGAVVDEKMDKCPGCGEPFEGDAEDGAVEDQGMSVDDDGTFFCSVCGATVKESSSECPKCGTEFE
jgi:RNA polymerase subunit RPABC4/transcription elongation factor Spt4